MKKVMLVLSLSGAALLSVLLYPNTTTGPSVSVPSVVQEQTPQPMYIVRVTDGVLTVYPCDAGEPVERTEIRASSLRSSDRQLMEQGFPLYSEQELACFLEDFGS